MADPRFKVGDRVRLNSPGKGEHGSCGMIEAVEPYSGPKYLDDWMYLGNWKFPHSRVGWRGHVPERWVELDPGKEG